MARTGVRSFGAPLAVFVGGCLGGALRLGIDSAVPSGANSLPLHICVINVIGAFALGALASWVAAAGARWWMPLAGTGALGSFTTFSMLSGLPWTSEVGLGAAVGLLAITTALAVAGAAAGGVVGTRVAGARPRRIDPFP